MCVLVMVCLLCAAPWPQGAWPRAVCGCADKGADEGAAEGRAGGAPPYCPSRRWPSLSAARFVALWLADSAAALRLALLVAGSMLLHECLCAPRATSAPRASAPRADARPVWQHPCGEKSPTAPGKTLLAGEPRERLRHPATKALRRQLAVSWQFVKKSRPLLRQLYGNFSKFGEMKYDWLPRMQLAWFQKYHQCSANKTAEVLPVFHRSLQNFSVTFEAMKKHGNSQIQDKDEMYSLRDPLLANITVWHKILLCETEAAIHHARLPAPDWASEDILSEHWPPSPDLTETLLRDWGVIRQYKTFLAEWREILKPMGRKEVAACKGAGAGAGAGAGSRAKPQRRQKQHAPP